MKEEWKNTILSRIKQRNVTQSEKYEDILLSYNSLIEEKNKLLTIIASLTSENIYLVNNKNAIFSFENNILNENSLKYNVLNSDTRDNINSMNNSKSDLVKYNNLYSYQSSISKKDILEIIREKGKNEELILLLKNSINEKERLLNIINKENEILNNMISKREEELFEKKKEFSKLNEIINRNKLEIKLYTKNNKLLKNRLELIERKNTILLREYECLRFTYLKLLRQNCEMKNNKKTRDEEYLDLRSQILDKKIENENLLKYLLKCKKTQRYQLKNLEKMCLYMVKYNLRNKYIFLKKNKLRVCLYLSKLNDLYNIRRYLGKIRRNNNTFFINKSNNYKNKTNGEIKEEKIFKKAYYKDNQKKNQSFQIINNKNNNSSTLNDEIDVKPYSSNSDNLDNQKYGISLIEKNICKHKISKNKEIFKKIKNFLNVHSGDILCFSAISSRNFNSFAIRKYNDAKEKKELKEEKINTYNNIKILRSYNDTNICIKNNDRLTSVGNRDFFRNNDEGELDHMIVTCGKDGKIAFVNIKNNELKNTKSFYILDNKLPAHNVCIHPSQKYTLVAMDNNNMYLINNKKNKVEYSYNDHKEKITSINFLYDLNCFNRSAASNDIKGSFFYSSSLDKTLKIWNVEKNICISTINVRNSITCSAVSSYGRNLLIGTNNGSVICYDLRINNKETINTILYNKNVFNEQVCGLNYSPDGQLIAIQSIRGEMKLLDTHKIKFLHTFETPYYVKNQIPKAYPIFSRYGNKILCSFAFNMISYDILNNSCSHILNSELDEITGVNWNLNDKLLTVHKDGNIAIW